MVLSGWAADTSAAGPSGDPTTLLDGVAGRQLRGVDDEYEIESVIEAARAASISGLAPLVWLTLATGFFFVCLAFVDTLMMPFEKLYVFVLSVERVLTEDLAIFMGIFSLFITVFYFTLYIVYPTAGGVALPQVDAFNTAATAINAMALLALLGEPVTVRYRPLKPVTVRITPRYCPLPPVTVRRRRCRPLPSVTVRYRPLQASRSRW